MVHYDPASPFAREEQMVASITKRDWEEFMAVGRVPLSVRELVLQSWQRSASSGITSLKSAPKLGESELMARRREARRLRLGARAALQKAGYLLNHTGNMLLLCNDRGVVLDVAGDEATQARGRENHLHVGGRWNESSIGTNAIGTAIHLRRPMQVSSVEHYCEEIHRWNCAATPITDPADGRLLGVVDISWPNDVEQMNAAALSATLALQIEADLGRNYAMEREKLVERLHMRRPRLGSDPVLVLDRTGRDVFATEDFRRLCDDNDALDSLRARIPDLMGRMPGDIAEALSGSLPGADLEVIAEGEDAVGVMLSLRRRRPVPVSNGAELDKIGSIGPVTFALCGQAQRLAGVHIPILIEGETGTGKTFLAQAIHRASPQAGGSFEMLDCSTLTAQALREDLARETRRSAMLEQLAESGGALCLDRPGATPEAQKLLLSLLEQVSARARTGIKLLSLSSTPLYGAMQEGRFRGDLYYRLAGARLVIPPLRERRQEIVPSLNMIAARHARTRGGRELRFTSGALGVLAAYHWPGNLLEMSNMVAALDALSPSGLIDERNLPPEMLNQSASREDHTLRGSEKAEILEAVELSGGNLTEAARRLGIARSTLYLKLDSYGIARPRRS
jgi:transcriptional regulator of acetoin/glycerol metabolism